jgi:hypothetical protein
MKTRTRRTVVPVAVLATGLLFAAPVASVAELAMTCQGEKVTIHGTDGADILVGTSGRDVIAGLGGDDDINGKGGHDIICGHGGDDVIRGGAGDDQIKAGSGRDVVIPGPGDDDVDGGGGVDMVKFGGADGPIVADLGDGSTIGEGSDSLARFERISGSKYGDTLVGDGQANRLLGRGGLDTLRGRDGNDDLRGGSGADDILAGPGDDNVKGGSGSDIMLGGSGDDTITGQGGFDLVDGGGGTDSCSSTSEMRFYCEKGHRTFSNGIWVVPGEVKPGLYRNTTSAGGCYWARLSGFGGGLDDINANNFTFVRDIVQVFSSDAGFESEDCGTWTNDLTPRTSSPTANFGGGAFVVGYEVGPGVWRNSSSDNGCYWERRSGFDGTLGDVIDNGFSFSLQTVQISSGDVGFYSEDCGTWTKIG